MAAKGNEAIVLAPNSSPESGQRSAASRKQSFFAGRNVPFGSLPNVPSACDCAAGFGNDLYHATGARFDATAHASSHCGLHHRVGCET